MIYQECPPSPEFASVIKLFWSLEYGGGAEPETIVPDGCPEIVFNLADRFRRFDGSSFQPQPTTLFAGQISRPLVIAPMGSVKLFGVRFTPAGAFAISRNRQDEFTDKTPDAFFLLGKHAAALEDAVNSASSFQARVAIVEMFVRHRTVNMDPRPMVAQLATNLITMGYGKVSISRLAEYLNRSERSLERDFRGQVGISPKLFARITRFQNVVRSVGSVSNAKMIETALATGYFDQSHMVRDFKEFAGTTPTEFFKRSHPLCDLFMSAA